MTYRHWKPQGYESIGYEQIYFPATEIPEFCSAFDGMAKKRPDGQNRAGNRYVSEPKNCDNAPYQGAYCISNAPTASGQYFDREYS